MKRYYGGGIIAILIATLTLISLTQAYLLYRVRKEKQATASYVKPEAEETELYKKIKGYKKPVYLRTEVRGTVYYDLYDWINETATHSIKQVKEISDADKITLVVSCSMGYVQENNQVCYIFKDVNSTLKSEPVNLGDIVINELKNRIIIVEGEIAKNRFYVKRIRRTTFVHS